MKPGWIAVIRAGLELARLVRAQTAKTCPYEKCPLRLHNATADDAVAEVAVAMTQDEMIRKQIALHKRNHPGGKP